jgi:hypothetical protein
VSTFPNRARLPARAVNKTSGVVTEADFQATVVDAAELFGWWVFHDHDSRRNTAGFPDLVLIRPPEVVFIELKREKGRVTTAQAGVLDMLGRCSGVDAYLWRPSDWAEIVERLQ